MIKVFANSWALFLGIGLLMIGNSLQGTLLGVRGKIEAFDPQTMGFVMSAYFIGFLGGSWMAPGLIRRVGYVRVFAALGSLISAAFIIYAVFVTPWAWALMRLVAVLNIADPGGYDLFILMSVVVSISFAPILLSASPAPLSDDTERMTLRELFEASPLGCTGSFLLGGVFASMFGMSAVYAGEIGLSLDQIAVFVSLMYVSALFSQYPIGWVSDRVDRRKVIALVMIIATLASAAGVFFSGSLLAIYIAAAVLGGMANPLYSLLLAHTNDYLPVSKMASASSGLVFINGVGASFGPIVVGYVMGAIGPDGFFVYNCILCALIAIYAIYRMSQRAAAAPDETGSFVPLAARGAVVAELAAEIYAAEIEEIEDDDFGDGSTRADDD